MTPASNKQKTVVNILSLCAIASASDCYISNLTKYVPDNKDNNSYNRNQNNKDNNCQYYNNNIGPIFALWAEKSTVTEDFVKSSTNLAIPEFCTLWYETKHIIWSH